MGLGKTASGGSGGSFASHERAAAAPPGIVIEHGLSADELYALNDELTQELSYLGWSAETEEDYDALNGLVHTVAESAPAQRKQLINDFAAKGNAELLERVQESVAAQQESDLLKALEEHVGNDNAIADSRDGEGKLKRELPDDIERSHLYDSYYGAAMWSTPRTDEDGNDLASFQDEYDEEDLSDDLKVSMKDDLAEFMISNRDLVNEYLASEEVGIDRTARLTQLGHDFWLTRNGHGAGFWDRGLGALGQRMTEAAKSAGPVDLYVGADGKVYGQ